MHCPYKTFALHKMDNNNGGIRDLQLGTLVLMEKSHKRSIPRGIVFTLNNITVTRKKTSYSLEYERYFNSKSKKYVVIAFLCLYRARYSLHPSLFGCDCHDLNGPCNAPVKRRGCVASLCWPYGSPRASMYMFLSASGTFHGHLKDN